ncbi:hypothetical protein CSOJ01_10545 [Colletotrichum sojae]|uniref:Uncharacterized protein n=1 Tax=Colletotrichum sojae TaxID=2175907 RepID=A0A8H6MPX9_9PEZI|nr:hypothetical protein CSOJ01_10545 [Colletotrichum sojae]
MDSSAQQDSPLSIVANITGIPTFIFAILAAVYARIMYLRNSREECAQVDASLSWFRTEFDWLSKLIRTAGERPEYETYNDVVEDMGKLEHQIGNLLHRVWMNAGDPQGKWTLAPKSWSSIINVGMAWLPVRTRALELVCEREALTGRIQSIQMSMISSQILEMEWRRTQTEAKIEERFALMEAQIHRLEGLVYRLMHRTRLGTAGDQSLDNPRQYFHRLSVSSICPLSFGGVL